MATTKMIAGLMGPTLLAIGIAMLVNARHFPEMAKQIGNDPGLIFVSGILLLVAGLAIVRVHNVWSGGWRVVVTVLGWLAVHTGDTEEFPKAADLTDDQLAAIVAGAKPSVVKSLAGC